MQHFRKILAPTDFSAPAEHGLRLAANVSRSYDGSVTILYVYDPMSYALPDGYVLYTSAQLSRMVAEFERRLADAQRLVLDAGAVHVETRLRQGIAPSEIADFAAEGDFDLIVMGTHGRTALAHLFLGSVAERVVRTAPCPVLTVRAPTRP